MENFTFFYRTESPFSQWHPASFEIDGINFNCTEQYMMYQKAQLFKDEEIAAKVLSAQISREQKELGRAVHNFHRDQWETRCK